jgi:hypothetical protein
VTKDTDPAQPDLFPLSVIPVSEALARMATILDSRQLADRELYHELCTGDQLAYQRCHPRYGGGPSFEFVQKEFFINLLKRAPQTSQLEFLAGRWGTRSTSHAERVLWAMRLIAEPQRLKDIMCWFFLDLNQFEKRYPAVNNVSPAPKQVSKSNRVTDHESSIKNEMTVAILERDEKLKGKGPRYDGIKMGYLEKVVARGWRAECERRGVPHLSRKPATRYRIGLVTSRHKPH